MTSYKPFAANFESHFAPEIFKAYMQCVATTPSNGRCVERSRA